MGNRIEDVTLLEKWVFADLSTSSFSDDERSRILDDVDDLEEDLVMWDRPIRKCLKPVQHPDEVTVYRRQIGDLRSYYLRDGDTLYCIGAGKRKSTYKQDLDRILGRAKDYFRS